MSAAKAKSKNPKNVTKKNIAKSKVSKKKTKPIPKSKPASKKAKVKPQARPKAKSGKLAAKKKAGRSKTSKATEKSKAAPPKRVFKSKMLSRAFLMDLCSAIKDAVAPMINAGKRDTVLDDKDGWTVRTRDGSLSAQFEHTVLMTDSGPEILTFTQNGPRQGHAF